jgi:voltage-gated potassium channel
MWLLTRVSRALVRHLRRVSWLAVLLALLVHMLCTWVLLALAGERDLVAANAFPYYYMTTATTIGYGDLAPKTTAGRMIVAFGLMPGAVAFFAAVLAKTSTSLASYWRRHLVGRMDYRDMKGHTVLVGWRGAQSEQLVRLLLADTATDDEGLALVAEGLAENPVPEHARFVAVASYADTASYERVAIHNAARIVIHPASDDQALAAVMAVMAHRPMAHVVAHFEGDAGPTLVRSHYPQVECTRPLSAEVLARAAQDPGSSALTQDLLCAEGQTQFSTTMPPGGTLAVGTVAERLKAHGGLLVGLCPPGEALVINPPDALPVPAGSVLYYLAPGRIDAAVLVAVAA